MLLEIAADVLEFDAHVFPSIFLLVNAAFTLAVRIFGSHGFDQKPEFAAYHSENVHDALLIDRRESEAAEIDRRAKLDLPVWAGRCGLVGLGNSKCIRVTDRGSGRNSVIRLGLSDRWEAIRCVCDFACCTK